MNKKRVLVALALLVFAFTLFIGFFIGLYVGIFCRRQGTAAELEQETSFQIMASCWDEEIQVFKQYSMGYGLIE